jgi:hypothetical protein
VLVKTKSPRIGDTVMKPTAGRRTASIFDDT